MSFAYKLAVAIKSEGFSNIRIYNGGLKDWIKSGQKIVSVEPLPDYTSPFISAAELAQKIEAAETNNCHDHNGAPTLTLLDFRASPALKKKIESDHFRVQTNCVTIRAGLDDFLLHPELVVKIPSTGLVVTISETGNRDDFLIRYLSKYGKDNIKGLEFGMRAWLISGYPVDKCSRNNCGN